MWLPYNCGFSSTFLHILFYCGYCLDATIYSGQLNIWLIDLLFYGFMQTSSDGTKKEIVGATTASYMPSIDDIGSFISVSCKRCPSIIGSFISVSCKPVRSDWARGPMVLSEKIGPIIPGTKHILFS